MFDSLSAATAGEVGLTRGTVVEVRGAEVEVAPEGGSTTLTCPVLEGATLRGPIRVGDPVILFAGGRGGVVLGRPADARAVSGADPSPADPEPREIPDELVLEAGHKLTLKVGDGSITIRRDGKILIKGRDLVSHATRTNRIRGGSVALN